VKAGFSTIERESAELNGSNYRDNVRQQSTELTEFQEADLIFPPYRPTQLTSMVGASPTEPKPGGPPPAAPAAPKKARGQRTEDSLPAVALAKAGGRKSKVRSRINMKPVELASGTSGVFVR
jgi:hypothetical protein